MKCQFCKKEFKTQAGYEKHSCLKKTRYDNLNVLAYYIWKIWHKFTRLKLSSDEEKNKIRFVGSKEYLMFEKFSKYLETVNPYDCSSFVKYLVDRGIPITKWSLSEHYHNWVYEYEKAEDKQIAIVRSKKYIESQNIDIKNISENRLFNLLYNGRISPWYISYIDIKLYFILGDDLLRTLDKIIKISL